MKLNQQFEKVNACVLVPTYNNDGTLKTVIDSILTYTNHLIIVNDGSTDTTKDILSEYKDLEIINFSKNKGKGMALRAGFDKAVELGYENAISIDSDGQHKASDLATFLTQLEKTPDALLVGARNMEGENVPDFSSFRYRFSNFWYKVNTGINLPDTQSGYRSYPVKLLKDIKWKTKRFEFEIEVLVRADWNDIEVSSVPIDVYYPPAGERVTHFRKIPDFTRLSILNACFVTIAFLYIWPLKLIKSARKKGAKKFFEEYIFDSSESNSVITLSVALGIFIGITPFWGYQIMLIIIFAQLFKLNKAIAIVAGHISIPPTIPFILYGSYRIGGWLIGNKNPLSFSSEITMEVVRDNLLQYIIGAFVLAAISAVIFAIITYILLLLFRPKKPIKELNL